MKTIQDMIDHLDALADGATIYARLPWSPDSDADVKTEPEDGSNPCEAQGLAYFLEVFIAKEVLGSMREESPLDRCLRVIRYAINDA
jgi:hypothetical protein